MFQRGRLQKVWRWHKFIIKPDHHCCVWSGVCVCVRGWGEAVLTAGHAGEAASVIEVFQSLAGVIRPVHSFPTLHAGSCRDTNAHLVGSNGSAGALSALFTTHSWRMCLKSNSTQSVNTCKSSRSHHLGDFHTVKTSLPMPACLLIHSWVSAEPLCY